AGNRLRSHDGHSVSSPNITPASTLAHDPKREYAGEASSTGRRTHAEQAANRSWTSAEQALQAPAHRWRSTPSRAQTRAGAVLSRLLLLLLLLLLLVLVLGSPSSRSTRWNRERTGSQQAPNRLSTHNPIAEQPRLPPARFSGVLPCRQGV